MQVSGDRSFICRPPKAGFGKELGTFRLQVFEYFFVTGLPEMRGRGLRSGTEISANNVRVRVIVQQQLDGCVFSCCGGSLESGAKWAGLMVDGHSLAV
jgi:hypothetical protein